MRCSRCGSNIKDGSPFCTRCGSKVNSSNMSYGGNQNFIKEKVSNMTTAVGALNAKKNIAIIATILAAIIALVGTVIAVSTNIGGPDRVANKFASAILSNNSKTVIKLIDKDVLEKIEEYYGTTDDELVEQLQKSTKNILKCEITSSSKCDSDELEELNTAARYYGCGVTIKEAYVYTCYMLSKDYAQETNEFYVVKINGKWSLWLWD